MRIMQWLSRPPYVSLEQRKAVVAEALKSLSKLRKNDGKYVEDFVRGWCFGAPLEDIWRGNVVQFFCWSIFYKFPVWTQTQQGQL